MYELEKTHPNEIVNLGNGVIAIKMTQGKRAIIDAKYYPLARNYRWRPLKSHKTFYAISSPLKKGISKTVRLHRLILNVTNPKIQADHIDRNGLNNRRNNLRTCTPHENNWNRYSVSKSGFRGVVFCHGIWKASITVYGLKIKLGRFQDPVSAALRYNVAAKKHFGKFAVLNKV